MYVEPAISSLCVLKPASVPCPELTHMRQQRQESDPGSHILVKTDKGFSSVKKDLTKT